MQILSWFHFSRNGLQAVVLALLLIVLTGANTDARENYTQFADRILASPPDGATVRADLEAAVLRGTNAYLSSQGLKPLKSANAVLLKAARAQAMDLLIQGGMGHVSGNGYDFQSRIRAFHPGQMFLPVMAENAARLRNSGISDSAKAEVLVQQWVKSSGHRRNMVNRSYVMVAVGVVSRGRDVYAVQVFSGPVVKTNMMGGGILN